MWKVVRTPGVDGNPIDAETSQERTNRERLEEYVAGLTRYRETLVAESEIRARLRC